MIRVIVFVMGASLFSSCNNDQSTSKKTEPLNMTADKTVAWAHTTNIYEVNLRQYTREGTFTAFRKELPRLKDMGVETLWFMPITPISQKNKKGILGSPYACSDYTSINPELGTLQDFKDLVSDAHANGFKVIIDWVANHTGWDHVWTVKHPDYFLKDSLTHDFKVASGMEDIIELDYSNPALRQAMVEAMQYWVREADIDGFRCDLAAWVEVDFWREARQQVDTVKKIFWLGEFDEFENPDYGEVFDASYTWTWMHKAKEYYQNHLPLQELDSLLQRYSAIGDGSMRTWFTTNHDENSWNGTEYEKYGKMAGALAVFSATWNGVPLIYSGQELPNVKRLQFFEKDVIGWTGRYELHDFYQTLLRLRRNNPALRAADPAVITYRLNPPPEIPLLSYLRKNGSREVMVILNLSNQPLKELSFDKNLVNGRFRDIFSGETKDFSNDWELEIKPWGYRVFEK